MDELTEFRTVTAPQLQTADTALHNGDPRGRIAMWSQQAPVTLFGAFYSATTWPEIRDVFERLGREFSDCTQCEHEIVATEVSGDLAYVVAYEHTTASLGGAPPTSYTLRVTTIFRREDGQWRVVHRHGDRPPAGS